MERASGMAAGLVIMLRAPAEKKFETELRAGLYLLHRIPGIFPPMRPIIFYILPNFFIILHLGELVHKRVHLGHFHTRCRRRCAIDAEP